VFSRLRSLSACLFSGQITMTACLFSGQITMTAWILSSSLFTDLMTIYRTLLLYSTDLFLLYLWDEINQRRCLREEIQSGTDFYFQVPNFPNATGIQHPHVQNECWVSH
jgi:hypothetical protein